MIWFNQAATSFPKPEAVYKIRDQYFRQGVAGHGRGLSRIDRLSALLGSQCKNLLAELFCARASEVHFTSGATEAINIILANEPRGSLLVSTQSRHNALRRSAHAGGFREILLPPLTLDNFKGLLQNSLEGASLLALNGCSNVNGHCEPIQEICAFVRQYFPSVHIAVDGAQAAGHRPLSMAWGIHYLALTAHKGLYGPAGLGALISPLDIKPLIHGGTGEHSQRLEQGAANFEAGTRDGASIGAWLEGLKFVRSLGWAAIQKKEQSLTELFLRGIKTLPLTVFSGEGPLVSLQNPLFTSEELAALLESRDIVIRGGSHCAPDMHDFLGTKDAARFSFGWFNTEAEIQECLRVLWEIFGERP